MIRPLKIICCCSYLLSFLSPFVNLIVRLYLANIFIKAGLTKIDDWEATLFLFENEYQVPFLPYTLAAILSVIMELLVAPMLALGLATRYSSILLFIMTFIINYTYQEAAENYYWMLLFATLITYGGSFISLDFLIKRRFCRLYTKCLCCMGSYCSKTKQKL